MKLFAEKDTPFLLCKSDRILVFIMFFSYFFFYGLLNLNFFLEIPTRIPSGLMRLTTFGIAGFLILKDFSNGEYPRMTASIICLGVFLLYYFCVFVVDENVFGANFDMSTGSSMQRGKLEVAYLFFISALSYFLMFFAGRRRMAYVLANPSLVYIPSLLSVLIIILTNIRAFGTMDLYQTYLYDFGDVRRAAIIAPVGTLISVSPYLMFFSKNRLCNFFWGPLGCAAALMCVLISDSRSTILAMFLVLVFYAFVSIRHVYSIVYALIVYISGAVLFIPYLLMSAAFSRFMNIEKILDYDLVENDQLSRIELIKAGFSQFLDSPILGGHIYLIGGGYSHCTPICILYSTGLIGFSLALTGIVGVLKGIFAAVKIFREKIIWICALGIFDVVGMLIHSDSTAIFCGSFAVFLMANAFMSERRN